MGASIALSWEKFKLQPMTGIQLAVHKMISGCGFLPEADQKGLYETMRALEAIFAPGNERTEAQRIGIREIEEGVMLLLKHTATGLLSKDGLTRKMALVKQAAEELHPEFLAKFRRG
jgi:hypothetical protein